MKSTKSMALVAAFLLILTGVWFLPNVSGKSPENSLPDRVSMLEEIVAELSLTVDELNERVEELEGGQGGSCVCDILNLQPYEELPTEGNEGDICLLSQDIEGGYYNINLYAYIDDEWRVLPHTYIPPGPGPGPITLP